MIEGAKVPADYGQSAAQQNVSPNPSMVPVGEGPSNSSANGYYTITDSKVSTIQAD
jgi:hypothetical protein